jgi:transposase-like protein
VPRVRYSDAQKREAVALARVMGADSAAASLHIDPRTVRKWSAQAGHGPELDGSAEGWQRLLDLAQSRVAVALAADKVRPKDAAVIAAIAERNLRQLEARSWIVDEPSSVDAREAFFGWVIETLPDMPAYLEDQAAIEAYVNQLADAIGSLSPELLRRANAELAPDRAVHNPEGSHRLALLAWFSGRPEIPAGDILEWAKAQVLEVIEQHGSLVAWHAFQQAEDEAEQVRRVAEYAANRVRAEALKAEADKARLDAEARARLAAAELSRSPRI